MDEEVTRLRRAVIAMDQSAAQDAINQVKRRWSGGKLHETQWRAVWSLIGAAEVRAGGSFASVAGRALASGVKLQRASVVAEAARLAACGGHWEEMERHWRRLDGFQALHPRSLTPRLAAVAVAGAVAGGEDIVMLAVQRARCCGIPASALNSHLTTIAAEASATQLLDCSASLLNLVRVVEDRDASSMRSPVLTGFALAARAVSCASSPAWRSRLPGATSGNLTGLALSLASNCVAELVAAVGARRASQAVSWATTEAVARCPDDHATLELAVAALEATDASLAPDSHSRAFDCVAAWSDRQDAPRTSPAVSAAASKGSASRGAAWLASNDPSSATRAAETALSHSLSSCTPRNASPRVAVAVSAVLACARPEACTEAALSALYRPPLPSTIRESVAVAVVSGVAAEVREARCPPDRLSHLLHGLAPLLRRPVTDRPFSPAVGAAAKIGAPGVAESVLSLAEAHGAPITERMLSDTALAYAVQGDAAGAEATLERALATCKLDQPPQRPFFGAVIHAMSAAQDPRGARRVLRRMRRLGCAPTAQEYAGLVMAHASRGEAEAARRVMAEMEADGVERNEIVWGALLHAYAVAKDGEGAEAALTEATQDGLEPNSHLFTSTANAHARAGRAASAERVLDHALAYFPSAASLPLVHTVLKALAKAGDAAGAETLVRGVLPGLKLQATADTFSLLARAYANAGDATSALQLLEECSSINGGVGLTVRLCNSILAAQASASDAAGIVAVTRTMRESGLRADVVTFTVLARLYGQRQDLQAALRVIDTAVAARVQPDEGLFRVVLHACVIMHDQAAAEQVAAKMKECGFGDAAIAAVAHDAAKSLAAATLEEAVDAQAEDDDVDSESDVVGDDGCLESAQYPHDNLREAGDNDLDVLVVSRSGSSPELLVNEDGDERV